MKVYRLFDQFIACVFPIPGLPMLERESFDWRVDWSAETTAMEPVDFFYRWQGPGGDEVMACARQVDGYLLDFNGLACFSIDFAARTIAVRRLKTCPENTVAHLLIDQVIPRILCHRGRMVLHASAVELAGGRAVAFTGPSGVGKSTLASAFLAAGDGLITDDCLLLENRSGAVQALPSYPSLRLWPDSARVLQTGKGLGRRRFSELAHYTDKKQILFEQSADSGPVRWVKLDRLYVLDHDPEFLQTGPVQIIPAGGMASIMALIEAMFSLDMDAQESVRKSFKVTEQVAGGVVVKRLVYRRDYEILSRVLAAVKEDVPGLH